MEPTPKTHASSAVNVVHAQANQTDLTQWPWPQIFVYGVLLALFVFGGPGSRLIAVIRDVYNRTIGALARWVVFLPPILTAEESLADPHAAQRAADTKIAILKGSDATATLHVALCVAGAGMISILSTSGLPLFSNSAKTLVSIAVVLIFTGTILDLVALLRDYGYTANAYNLAAVGARKLRLVKVASLCFIAGVFLLFINAWWSQSHQPSAPPGLRTMPGAFGRTY